MATPRPAKAEVVTYGDHEVITPDTAKFRKLVALAQPGDEDPVVQAEQALAQIANEFSDWMQQECERLELARQRVKSDGLSRATSQELFLSAHDVKGDSGTFGYPAVAPAADSLCRLLEYAPNLENIPFPLIEQHVDAVRAIFREYARDDILTVASALTMRLRHVTDEFLLAENRHDPERLKQILSTALTPADAL